MHVYCTYMVKTRMWRILLACGLATNVDLCAVGITSWFAMLFFSSMREGENREWELRVEKIALSLFLCVSLSQGTCDCDVVWNWEWDVRKWKARYGNNAAQSWVGVFFCRCYPSPRVMGNQHPRRYLYLVLNISRYRKKRHWSREKKSILIVKFYAFK